MGARVSIGDFAVMTSLSRKALRHYHDIGVLAPVHVDSHTGYRFYDTGQVDHAHIIRRFRSLGMSIPDIKALLSTEDAAARTEIITTHLEQMEVQLQQTRDTVGALRELLSPVHTPAHVELHHEPALAVWSVGATIDVSEIDSWFGVALGKLREAIAAAASAPFAVVPGGLYDRALFLESRGKANSSYAAPEFRGPPGGRPCRGPISGRIRGAHPFRRSRRHRPQLRGSGTTRKRAPDQRPGANPRTLPWLHALRSNNVHRHRDLLADLQHHPTARMTAVLDQFVTRKGLSTQRPSVRPYRVPTGGTDPAVITSAPVGTRPRRRQLTCTSSSALTERGSIPHWATHPVSNTHLQLEELGYPTVWVGIGADPVGDINLLEQMIAATGAFRYRESNHQHVARRRTQHHPALPPDRRPLRTSPAAGHRSGSS